LDPPAPANEAVALNRSPEGSRHVPERSADHMSDSQQTTLARLEDRLSSLKVRL
jgi:hypothetical protein